MVAIVIVIVCTLAAAVYLCGERVRAKQRERERFERVMRNAEMRHATNRRVTTQAYEDAYR
jgi:hypothetical protein